MENGRCTKGYPKPVSEITTSDNDGYPVYKRPNNGKVFRSSPNSMPITNQWVVPHNLYLSTKYNTHLNVEVCTTVKAVKYLYKYVYKGHDRAMISMQNVSQQSPDNPSNPPAVNEVQQFLDARYISAPEAVWRIFHMPLFKRSPAVKPLALHLPGQNTVYFRPNERVEQVRERAEVKLTTLLPYFRLNRLISQSS